MGLKINQTLNFTANLFTKKAKTREFDEMIKKNFLENDIPKENY